MTPPSFSVSRNKAILSNFRLTLSKTEVEYWEYKRGFLQHAREVKRGERSEQSERRKDNLNAVRNTVRRLVNSNVNQYGFEATFLTFTYKENQDNIDIAWRDWACFMRDFRKRFGVLHALSVMEFQKRGAIHFHCIFFNLPPIVEARERETREVAKRWGHGFVDIERVRSAKNVGAYVCKYLNKSADDPRLRGKKFYSTTRNLIRPVEYVGEFAKNKMLAIMSDSSKQVELLAETQYAYGGMPVVYRNYKIVEQICSS